jgi:cell division transport system permease protein
MNEQAAANVQASQLQTRMFGAWLDHHGFSIVASLGRLLRKPWATLLTIGVMAVALALPLGWARLANLQHSPATSNSRAASTCSSPEVDVVRARALAAELRGPATWPA